jgi:hypothetical protein
MALQIGIIAQSFPAASAATPLYTVPVGYSLVLSSIIINNQASAADKVWVSFRKGGAPDNTQQYYLGAGPAQSGGGFTVGIANPFAATLGLTFGTGDQIYIQSLNGTSSFQIFGSLES